ncbi:helix-turn-helix domain-containing protein [Chitinophaga filiformis]|uniref:AraC family transcriptional regulator n=1 Tax=Chitinophaga filiformis TaxID=104663 RepID=A0ABY4HW81_CHIFI|nr:AraC family transcriptional regulator [Chitinophaga filiformis]UPK68043.1 AraC family transcriptional regulator [Chitinophaga filiformis]
MRNCSSTRLTKRSVEIATKAITYIDRNYDQPITQESLSYDFNVPVRILQAAFQKLVNASVHKYLEKKRLEAAMTMLEDEEISIKEIYTKVGYSSQSHFGEFFKKHTGITPAQYRIRKTA